jgi:hypothetical protein
MLEMRTRVSLPQRTERGTYQHRSQVIGVYGGHGRDRRRTMNAQDFSTEYIGAQLMRALTCGPTSGHQVAPQKSEAS